MLDQRIDILRLENKGRHVRMSGDDAFRQRLLQIFQRPF